MGSQMEQNTPSCHRIHIQRVLFTPFHKNSLVLEKEKHLQCVFFLHDKWFLCATTQRGFAVDQKKKHKWRHFTACLEHKMVVCNLTR